MAARDPHSGPVLPGAWAADALAKVIGLVHGRRR